MTANIKQNVTRRSVSSPFQRRWQRGYSQSGAVSSTALTVVFGITALAFVGALGFFYLHQIVNTASQGTDIHELESRIIELNERQRQLELEGAQLRSLQTVEDRIQETDLIVTDRVSYLAPTQDQLALSVNE